MNGAPTLYWFSPTRSPRALASELRQHGPAWTRLVSPRRPRLTNYGDELSRSIVERMFGARVSWAPIDRAQLVALGSIIDLYAQRRGIGRLWGSGIADPDRAYDEAAIADKVVGVRGPLTRDRLRLPSDTPLGDPGLLAPDFWSWGPRVEGERVLVPHYRAFLTADGRRAIRSLQRDGYTVMPPNVRPEEMMRAIAQASFVASSGLHGVILAQAYGTPSALVSFDDEVPAAPVFKYRDFYASIDAQARLRSWRSVLSTASTHGSVLEQSAADVESSRQPVARLVDSLRASGRRLG